MLKNYLKIAWRNLIKDKATSLINIGGLAIGMAVASLIALWIWDEVSYNKSFENFAQIAKVMHRGSFQGKASVHDAKPRPLEFELREKYGSSFKHIVMSRWTESHILSVADRKINQNGRFMQAGAPDMLSLNMISGNRSTALIELNSIIISSSTAVALFGSDDAMGKVIKLDNQTDVKITGVYKDLPYNTEFAPVKFIAPWDLLMTRETWIKEAEDNWGNNSFLIYVQIQLGATFEEVSRRIKPALQDNVDEYEKQFNKEVFLHPMSKWHLYNEWKDGRNAGGRIQFVWLFGIIGIFVLLLACINFMNLSTARSEKRAREVGVRKAVGSNRKQLIDQFLTESFLITIVSSLIALAIVVLALPFFNDLADKQMIMFWGNPVFWLCTGVFIVFTSLIAGSYPAFYLSSFNPVEVLKGRLVVPRLASIPRKALVVCQFTVSVTLIIGTIIVYKQIQYAKNRPIGYNKNGLLGIPVKSDDLIDKFNVISERLKTSGVATDVAFTSSPLTNIDSNNDGFEWKGKQADDVESFGTIWISHDYGKTVGWQFTEGRDFSRQFAKDSISAKSQEGLVYSMIINEAAARYMNLKNPVGEIVKWEGNPFRIIGVVKDQVMESPYTPVKQTIFLVNYGNANAWIYLRLNPNLSSSAALDKLTQIFKKIVPAVPLEYSFADVEYGRKFIAEERIGKLATVFAVLAIFISCLGLLGLAFYVALQRGKEVCIRKVLGATVVNLWYLLSREFMVLILVSCLFAFPLSWHFLFKWLQGYDYRIEMPWWAFGATGIGALVITLITVSFQAIKAALANPVKILRSE